MNLEAHKTTAVAALALLMLVLGFCFQGVRGIWEPDEGYYTGSAVSMDAQHNYLMPTLGEEEIFLDKPPVLYWGILGGLKLFGHSEFAARFFTGLCFALTTMVVLALERSLSGRFDRAFWAAVMYATMVIPFSAANFVTPDTPLTFFTTLSMLLFWLSIRPNRTRSNLWLLLLAVTVAVGFLTKGPAALIPCGGMFVYLLAQKQTRRFFLNPWIVVAALVFAAVGLSWYVYIALKLPNAGEYFFDNMIWGRLVTSKYQRNPGMTGALIYVPVSFLGTMPWSVMWYGNDRRLSTFFAGRTWKDLLADPVKIFLACWVIVPLIILSTASSKLGLYALPIFPALALATARLLPTDPETRAVHPPKILFLLTWTGLLLLSRVAIAAIPSANDGRSIWHEINPYLPASQYEIVTVDRRISGLWFYGAQEVENVTRSSTPYPTFVPTEKLDSELETMQHDDYPHVFLLQSDWVLTTIQDALPKDDWTLQEFPLKYGRRLLICTPSLSKSTSQ